ncbi:hypothetical protein GCM10027571_16280 [Polaromonas eurypsychrophila]
MWSALIGLFEGSFSECFEGLRERVRRVDKEGQQGGESPPWLAKQVNTVWLQHILFVPW